VPAGKRQIANVASSRDKVRAGTVKAVSDKGSK
jgi:hypothetical protein